MNSFSFKKVKQAFYLIFVCQLIILIEVSFYREKEELLVYNNYVNSMVTYRKDKELIVIGRESLTQKDSILLKENQLKNDIERFVCHQNKVFVFKENVYLIINKNEPYNLLSQKRLILIMSNNPKVNFERLLNSLKPKQVIIASSNYISNQLKWKSTCRKLQVPFYVISELGAYKKN